MSTAKDYSGNRYGKAVAWFPTTRRLFSNVVWMMRCDCGTEFEAATCNFKSLKSCGCLNMKHPNYIHTDPISVVYKQTILATHRREHKGEPISLEQYRMMATAKCTYCSAPPGNDAGEGVKYQGIDRVDNNVGYIPGNCVPACFRCNRIKGAFTYDEFRAHILSMAMTMFNSYDLGMG